MEKNVFENAYFGKAYKTRDGRKAIYNYHSTGGYHDIIIDGEGMSYHFADHTNGIIRLPHPSEIDSDVDYSCPIDIVSEWQEEINEEELDEMAEKSELKHVQAAKQCEALGQCYGFSYTTGYKDGCHKAKEE